MNLVAASERQSLPMAGRARNPEPVVSGLSRIRRLDMLDLAETTCPRDSDSPTFGPAGLR